MKGNFAYNMGVLVGLQKRAEGDDKPEKKPVDKEPEDPFAGARQQFLNILGASPEEMQGQQQFRLGLLGRSAPVRAMAATLRQAFAPLTPTGGA